MNAADARDLVLRIEEVEARAWQQVHERALAVDAEALGLRMKELAGGLIMTADRVESLLHNRVLGLGLREPLSVATLDVVLEHYRGGPPGFAINLCPLATRDGLERDLAARGFATFFHHLKWVRDAAPAVPVSSTLRIERIEPARALAWGALSARILESPAGSGTWIARTVGSPGWSHYFACDGTTPVAVGAMFVHGDVAWLGFGATLESHRRRGAQGSLFAARITDAIAQGVRWLTTETAPDWPDVPGESVRNAKRAGFHPAYERPSWIWPAG